MTCTDCGADCVGDRCQHCDRFDRRDKDGLGDHPHFECPCCGGRTSGKGVVCATCRSRGDH